MEKKRLIPKKEKADAEFFEKNFYEPIRAEIDNNEELKAKFNDMFSHLSPKQVVDTYVELVKRVDYVIFMELGKHKYNRKTPDELAKDEEVGKLYDDLVYMVLIMEVELKRRNRLEKVVSQATMVDYETETRVTYSSYFFRFCHLIEMASEGILEEYRIEFEDFAKEMKSNNGKIIPVFRA